MLHKLVAVVCRRALQQEEEGEQPQAALSDPLDDCEVVSVPGRPHPAQIRL